MTIGRWTLCTVLSALVLMALPANVSAQDKSRSQGFFLGVGYEGTAVKFEDDDDSNSGAGFGITAGYGFNRLFSLYGHLSGASVDDGGGGDYDIGHFDIGTRVHFRAPAKTVVPFIQAGLSSRAVQQDDGINEVKGSGIGLAFGGGINAHFNRALAFSAGLVWSAGNIGDFKVNDRSVDLDSTGMTSARISLGIVWFPQQK